MDFTGLDGGREVRRITPSVQLKLVANEAECPILGRACSSPAAGN